jgi:predicted RNA-binding protein with PUA domain
MHRNCLIKVVLNSCESFGDAERARKLKLTECADCRAQAQIDQILYEKKEAQHG